MVLPLNAPVLCQLRWCIALAVRAFEGRLLSDTEVFAKEITRIQKLIVEDNKPEEALERLTKLYDDLGEDFTQAQLVAFHQMRGAARIQVGDYKGALADFRIVEGNGLPPDSADAIVATIRELVQIVAAQEAAAASASEGEPQARR